MTIRVAPPIIAMPKAIASNDAVVRPVAGRTASEATTLVVVTTGGSTATLVVVTTGWVVVVVVAGGWVVVVVVACASTVTTDSAVIDLAAISFCLGESAVVMNTRPELNVAVAVAEMVTEPSPAMVM